MLSSFCQEEGEARRDKGTFLTQVALLVRGGELGFEPAMYPPRRQG